MFQPTREQSRQLFFNTWLKYRLRKPLSGIENIAIEIILLHPEYHEILNSPDKYIEQDYLPESGTTNPFLHMALHIAVKEQLSINQPIGICDRFNRLLKKKQDEHTALHMMMECLAEMIWYAQRLQSPPDASRYFTCLDKQLGD